MSPVSSMIVIPNILPIPGTVNSSSYGYLSFTSFSTTVSILSICSLKKSITAYINAAMRKAHYKNLPENEGYFGKIEVLQGVWANADSLEACREELREVLEEWILLGIKMGQV